MTRQFTTVSLAAGALLCAVLWPTPLYAQQTGRPATPTAARAVRAVPQGFSVVLVVGDLQGGGGDDDVPVAARRALADMKDFLPYKSYKLVDAAWIVGTTHAVSRLRGPEDRDYELEITTSDPRMARLTGTGPSGGGTGDAKVGVSFSLRDTGAGRDEGASGGSGASAASNASTRAFLQQQLEEARSQYRAARAKYSSPHPDVERLEQQIESLQQKINEQERQVERRTVSQSRGSRAVINTSFTMDIGETVVVGTSRLSGNSKALIALLTAVPQKSSRR